MCVEQSTSVFDFDYGMTPTKILSMAIKKRRELNSSKIRYYRLEVLQTTFIQTLCKHLSERRARRRARKLEQNSQGTVSTSENMSQNDTSNEATQTRVVPVIQNHEPPQKRMRNVEPEEDPFGLNEFFENVGKRNKKTGESSP